MKEFVCLAMFVILSTLFAVAMLAAGFVCQYKNKTFVKNSTYECGIVPTADARIQFDIIDIIIECKDELYATID